MPLPKDHWMMCWLFARNGVCVEGMGAMKKLSSVIAIAFSVVNPDNRLCQ